MQPIELTYDERERLAKAHYAQRYEVLVDHPFVAPKPIRLNDHIGETKPPDRVGAGYPTSRSISGRTPCRRCSAINSSIR